MFQLYQEDGRLIMKGSVQWSSVYGWEDFASSRDQTRSTRSGGQHLTHWATGLLSVSNVNIKVGWKYQGSVVRGIISHHYEFVSQYRIYLAKRGGFPSLEWLQISKSVLWNFAIIWVLPFLNNSKDLDPSNKLGLDFWVVLEEKNSVL